MPAEVLSGRALSGEIIRRISRETPLLRRPPCLAVVMVGTRPDSARYVAMKRRAAKSCGIRFRLLELPAAVAQAELQAELLRISSDADVDAVLLQLPLPPRLRARPALLCIDPRKDVDGLHPLNAGNLFLQEGPEQPESADPLAPRSSLEDMYFLPCTALAVRAMLLTYLSRAIATTPRGNLHAVILNTSMVVGVPTAALLQKEKNFIVTLCSRATDLAVMRGVSRGADILITALGRPRVITSDFVKDGAVVIDVAINEDTGSGARRKLCGDVDAVCVGEKAAALSPVPGGVGPLTVAYLMHNTLKAYHLAEENKGSIPASFASMYAKQLESEEHGDLRAVDDMEAVAEECCGEESESSFDVV